MNDIPKHKVFVSYHHEDQDYKDRFARMMEGYIVDRSVGDGDIDDRNIRTETIRQRIRDDFIRDATVNRGVGWPLHLGAKPHIRTTTDRSLETTGPGTARWDGPELPQHTANLSFDEHPVCVLTSSRKRSTVSTNHQLRVRRCSPLKPMKFPRRIRRLKSYWQPGPIAKC